MIGSAVPKSASASGPYMYQTHSPSPNSFPSNSPTPDAFNAASSLGSSDMKSCRSAGVPNPASESLRWTMSACSATRALEALLERGHGRWDEAHRRDEARDLLVPR